MLNLITMFLSYILPINLFGNKFIQFSITMFYAVMLKVIKTANKQLKISLPIYLN